MGILRKIFGKDDTTNVLDILEAQHKDVDMLIEQLEAGEGNRRELFTELADNLAAHAAVEEKLFYPFVMARQTSEMLHEAVEEHLALKRLLADMLTMNLDDDTFHAKLSVLKEQVTHHAHKEEEDKLFPKVRDMFTADELAGIGNELIALFEEMMATNPSQTVPAETAEAAQLPPVTR